MPTKTSTELQTRPENAGQSPDGRWNVLKQSWRLFFIIISSLIAIGTFQINAFSINVPEKWQLPLVMAIVLLGSLISAAVSFVKVLSLQHELAAAGQTIEKLKSDTPLFFIEDVPVQGLTTHMFQRREHTPNPVHLELLELNVSIQGAGARRDAEVHWRFVGVNTADTILTNLQITIAGETLIPLNQLRSAVHDVGRDPQRTTAIVPRLVGQDSTNKRLMLPFLSPGIKPYEHFELELTYLWPGVVNVQKDYWFVDPANHAQSVECVQITLTSAESIMGSAAAFELDSTNRKIKFQGSIQIEVTEGQQVATYRIEKPAPDCFYLIIVEGRMGTMGVPSSFRPEHDQATKA